MKKLIFILILPLTVISFIIFTKWWDVMVIDGWDETMYGFPFIYTCRGFHTSLSAQYFIVELLLNVVTYFLFWLLVVYLINKFLFSIKLNTIISITLIVLSVICLGLSVWVTGGHENRLFLKRDFDIQKKESGFTFVWQSKNP